MTFQLGTECKNIFQYLNVKPIQCGTAVLEGGKPKQTGACKFYLRVFPCSGGLWGLGQGKDPGSTSSEKLKPFQTRSCADNLIGNGDFPEKLGTGK